MTDLSIHESPLAQLEKTVSDLLIKLDEVKQENFNLRKQLQAQQLIGDQLTQKNSRASQTIRRIISSIEGAQE
jgi:uncharacterized protein (TIGR02449 family)